MSHTRQLNQTLSWPLNPRPEGGALCYPNLEKSIRDQIKVILLTEPGQLLNHPTYGVGLQQYLHQPNSITLRRQIRDAVFAGVQTWERRIDIDAIDVSTGQRENAVHINIAYRIKQNQQAANVGLSLQLGS